MPSGECDGVVKEEDRCPMTRSVQWGSPIPVLQLACDPQGSAMVADQATVLIDKTSAVPSEETSILNVVEISEWINSVPHSDRLSALVSDRAYITDPWPYTRRPGLSKNRSCMVGQPRHRNHWDRRNE